VPIYHLIHLILLSANSLIICDYLKRHRQFTH